DGDVEDRPRTLLVHADDRVRAMRGADARESVRPRRRLTLLDGSPGAVRNPERVLARRRARVDGARGVEGVVAGLALGDGADLFDAQLEPGPVALGAAGVAHRDRDEVGARRGVEVLDPLAARPDAHLTGVSRFAALAGAARDLEREQVEAVGAVGRGRDAERASSRRPELAGGLLVLDESVAQVGGR